MKNTNLVLAMALGFKTLAADSRVTPNLDELVKKAEENKTCTLPGKISYTLQEADGPGKKGIGKLVLDLNGYQGAQTALLLSDGKAGVGPISAAHLPKNGACLNKWRLVAAPK